MTPEAGDLRDIAHALATVVLGIAFGVVLAVIVAAFQ